MSVVLTELSERILTVTINRPEKLNALNAEVIDGLARRVRGRAATNPDVGAVILTGAGEKAFVAGADIAEFRTFTPVRRARFARKGQATLDLIENLGKPVDRGRERLRARRRLRARDGLHAARRVEEREAGPARGEPRRHSGLRRDRSGCRGSWGRAVRSMLLSRATRSPPTRRSGSAS